MNTPIRDLVLSPQHRVLVKSKIVMRMFDTQEILIPAKHLIGIEGIDAVDDITAVTYYHIMCDNHEIIVADGGLAETLYTGLEAMKAMTSDAIAEIRMVFGGTIDPPCPLARPEPKGRQAKRLVSRHIKNDKQLFQAEQ